MSADTLHPAANVTKGRLWFGASAGAAAWAVHGFISVMIATQVCGNGRTSFGSLPPVGVRILLLLVTALFLGIASASAFVAHRNWRQLAGRRNLTDAEATRREEFMSLTGVFAGVVFSLGILWAGLPPVLVGVCVNAR